MFFKSNEKKSNLAVFFFFSFKKKVMCDFIVWLLRIFFVKLNFNTGMKVGYSGVETRHGGKKYTETKMTRQGSIFGTGEYLKTIMFHFFSHLVSFLPRCTLLKSKKYMNSFFLKITIFFIQKQFD